MHVCIKQFGDSQIDDHCLSCLFTRLYIMWQQQPVYGLYMPVGVMIQYISDRKILSRLILPGDLPTSSLSYWWDDKWPWSLKPSA
jgi:hypothetical protein